MDNQNPKLEVSYLYKDAHEIVEVYIGSAFVASFETNSDGTPYVEQDDSSIIFPLKEFNMDGEHINLDPFLDESDYAGDPENGFTMEDAKRYIEKQVVSHYRRQIPLFTQKLGGLESDEKLI